MAFDMRIPEYCESFSSQNLQFRNKQNCNPDFEFSLFAKSANSIQFIYFHLKRTYTVKKKMQSINREDCIQGGSERMRHLRPII